MAFLPIWSADSGERGRPGAPVEVAVPQRRALGTGEDESRGLAERGEVLAELGHDEVRERDNPQSGLRLGRPERVTAAALINAESRSTGSQEDTSISDNGTFYSCTLAVNVQNPRDGRIPALRRRGFGTPLESGSGAGHIDVD